MKKADVLRAIVESLQVEFRRLQRASEEARAGAGDEEMRAEGKYDTQSIEANYLADGQAMQAAQVAEAAAAFDGMAVRDFGADEAAGLGALVEVRLGGEKCWFFLGPASGGLEVTVAGREITVITPEAPLGGQLMGAKAGDKTVAPDAEVLAVC